MPITKYLWDGDNILAETDGNDTVTTVYTNEPQQYGNLVSQRSGSTTSYFHFDALGSTRQLTTTAGAVSDTFTYNAWGEEVARTGTTATPFRWIGELGYYWDTDRQLYYIRRRSYSAPLGRWLAVDPLFYWIGTVRARYATNEMPVFRDASFATRASSSYPWETLFGGCMWNFAFECHHVRNRWLHGVIGVRGQHNPLGLSPGLDLFAYADGAPLTYVDPLGTEATGVPINYPPPPPPPPPAVWGWYRNH